MEEHAASIFRVRCIEWTPYQCLSCLSSKTCSATSAGYYSSINIKTIGSLPSTKVACLCHLLGDGGQKALGIYGICCEYGQVFIGHTVFPLQLLTIHLKGTCLRGVFFVGLFALHSLCGVGIIYAYG
jgi:hypothetical protein